MSKSYTLSNDGTNWIAEGQLESGRKFRIVCAPATSTKEAAEAVADLKMAQRLQQSAASKTRWAKVAATNGAASAPAPASPAAAEKNASIRAKLLGVGDQKIDADAGDDQADAGDATVHPSLDDAKKTDADDDDDDDDDEGEDDEEAAELLADVIGTGIYNGLIVGGTAKLLKRGKPPRRPGEPHELFRRYSEEGLCHRVRKLIGKDSKLGPNGKLFVGLAGSIVMMVWNAEEIEPEPGAAAEPRGQTNGAPADQAKGSFQAKREAAAANSSPAADQKPRTELRIVRPPAPPPPASPPIGSTRPPAPPEPPDDNPIGRFR